MVTCSAPGRCLHTLQGDKQKVLWELMQSAAKPIVGSEEKKIMGRVSSRRCQSARKRCEQRENV